MQAVIYKHVADTESSVLADRKQANSSATHHTRDSVAKVIAFQLCALYEVPQAKRAVEGGSPHLKAETHLESAHTCVATSAVLKIEPASCGKFSTAFRSFAREMEMEWLAHVRLGVRCEHNSRHVRYMASQDSRQSAADGAEDLDGGGGGR